MDIYILIFWNVVQAFSKFCLTLLPMDGEYGIIGRKCTSLLLVFPNNSLASCPSSLCVCVTQTHTFAYIWCIDFSGLTYLLQRTSWRVIAWFLIGKIWSWAGQNPIVSTDGFLILLILDVHLFNPFEGKHCFSSSSNLVSTSRVCSFGLEIGFQFNYTEC